VERPQVTVGKLDVSQVFLPAATAATEEKPSLPVGKLDARSFLAAVALSEGTPLDKPAVAVGKLDTRHLFPEAAVGHADERPVVTVGKLDTSNLFAAAVDTTEERPAVTVGKLDTRNLFAPTAFEERPTVNVGKLDTRNLFTRPSASEELRSTVAPLVGKLDTKNVFPICNATEERSPPVVVGKLDARTLFPLTEADTERPRQPHVGKLNVQALFPNSNGGSSSNSSPTEVEAETRLYRPAVQPRRLKVDSIFTAASCSDLSPGSFVLFIIFVIYPRHLLGMEYCVLSSMVFFFFNHAAHCTVLLSRGAYPLILPIKKLAFAGY
jgi:hypothetical protein